mmetsp:Transcript_2079/g.2592  ORF Transcript_2079/g.2592 Transcript_2079/m.2592 type:complete len:345 (-) Transcript_2079:40-1074(-)
MSIKHKKMMLLSQHKSNQHESFQSHATVFLLNNKTWIERGSGIVQFVFDLKTYALRLVIEPGTKNQYDCKLRPRIRSKGPRAYVVRAHTENPNEEEHILAVRFEREEDSRAFRRFVEKRDSDHNVSSHHRNKSHSNHHNSGNSSNINNGITTQLGHLGINVPHNNKYSAYTNNNGLNTSQLIYQQTHNSNNNKYRKQNQQTSYVWTCGCFQLNDISTPICPVCGTKRNNSHQLGINNMSIGINNMNNINNINNMNIHMGNINQIKTLQQLNSLSIKNNQIIGHLNNNTEMIPKKKEDKIVVLKLTTENLDKHNLLYPQKRRNIKEIIQEQIKYWQYHHTMTKAQ